MAAMMNGMALQRIYSLRRYLLIFMEYARNAVRMAALMKQRVIYVSRMIRLGLVKMDRPTNL